MGRCKNPNGPLPLAQATSRLEVRVQQLHLLKGIGPQDSLVLAHRLLHLSHRRETGCFGSVALRVPFGWEPKGKTDEFEGHGLTHTHSSFVASTFRIAGEGPPFDHTHTPLVWGLVVMPDSVNPFASQYVVTLLHI